MEYTNLNLKKIFSNSELNTGKLIVKTNENIITNILNEPSVFYRCCLYESYLYFLLYDFKSLYYSRQSFDEVEGLNKKFNQSLEFTDVNNLLNFLLENILKVENGLQITKSQNDEINFEVLVNIIRVKWTFKCECLDLNSNLNYSLLQDLFVKPILNLLFTFQNFLSNEKKVGINSNSNFTSFINLSDAELFLGNANVNKQKNFDKIFLRLSQESTKKVNPIILEKDNSNAHKSKEENKRNKKENLKRKSSDTNDGLPNKQKNLKRRKEYDNDKEDSVSIEREKSSERTITDDEKIISKVHLEKKKKPKLKFV